MKSISRFMVAFVLAPSLAAAASLRLEPRVVAPGVELEITFTADRVLPDEAWIAIVPADAPHGNGAVVDEHDVDYAYVGGSDADAVSLRAPGSPGRYELRLLDGTDERGRELAVLAFEVRRADAAEASMRLGRTTLAPDETFEVVFRAPAGLPDTAWVGVVPSEVPHGSSAVNDEHDVDYQYLGGDAAGTLEFRAPARTGSWDLRMHDTVDEGVEIASVTFEVRHPDASGASLRLDRTTVAAGDLLRVRFTAPATFSDTAWVGIVPSTVPHGDEERNDRENLGWDFLHQETSGTLELHAPTEPGAYDLRMHDADAGGREVASASFTVTAGMDAGELAVRLERDGSLALYGIRFATDSAEITTESATVLEQVGELLRRQPELALRIEGHTDSTGNPDHNLRLSELRAASVKAYLVATFAVGPDRLETAGHGAGRPVADNATAAGRALNRRVELVRLDPS